MKTLKEVQSKTDVLFEVVDYLHEEAVKCNTNNEFDKCQALLDAAKHFNSVISNLIRL